MPDYSDSMKGSYLVLYIHVHVAVFSSIMCGCIASVNMPVLVHACNLFLHSYMYVWAYLYWCVGDIYKCTRPIGNRIYSASHTHIYIHIHTYIVSLKGSWKIKIRDRLKHMRRPSKRVTSDKENQPVETPSKRRKTRPNRLDEATEDLEPEDEQSFRDDLKEMERETAKKKTKIARLKPLMDSTFSGRRHWVKTEMPPVSIIMEKFPALKIPRLVR